MQGLTGRGLIPIDSNSSKLIYEEEKSGSPSLQFIEIQEDQVTQFKNEDQKMVKVLKISRQRSLNNIEQTPTPTEGGVAPSGSSSNALQLSYPTNIHPPKTPHNLPPQRKYQKHENKHLSKNENAMRMFQFRPGVDELDSRSSIT